MSDTTVVALMGLARDVITFLIIKFDSDKFIIDFDTIK